MLLFDSFASRLYKSSILSSFWSAFQPSFSLYLTFPFSRPVNILPFPCQILPLEICNGSNLARKERREREEGGYGEGEGK